MTNEEIIKKAIDKAEKNGYVVDFTGDDLKVFETSRIYFNHDTGYSVNDIIFSHDFAKAFFSGDNRKYDTSYSAEYAGDGGLPIQYVDKISYWQLQLSIMVLKPDPLKYIEKFLDTPQSI